MSLVRDFRRRAFYEARRYGGDAWVFVRELLQNSRDAGARRVDLTVESGHGVDRIVCRDDGCGMSFDHARRYLFTLYASSKSGQSDTAGRFGIGFWSVLRFEPDSVVVRSAPTGELGWQLGLSGDLEEIVHRELSLDVGTEVELVRPARGGDLERAVWDAVRRDAHHLRCRDGKDRILRVFVNSRLATSEIELEPPSLNFARRGLRGAVALTDRPQVDLLAHGLRVRTAATLDELLTQPDRRRRRRSNTPQGLTPRVILDSRRLQILMARGDARTDRELRQAVAVGRRGVRRLVRGQLDREAGLGWFGRPAMRCLEVVSTKWARRFGAAVVAVAILTAGAWWMTGLRSGRSVGLGVSVPKTVGQILSRPGVILRAEVADRYRGPAVDPLESQPAEISLRYEPSMVEPMLAVFRVIAMDDDGRVVSAATNSVWRPYLGAACRTSCIDITLDLDVEAGGVRLPVPTGHVLDPRSLRFDGGRATLRAAADGGPLLVVEEGFRGRARYQTGAAVEGQIVVGGSWPNLPAAANDVAASLRQVDADEAARRASNWVRQRVVYDNSESTADRHRQAVRDGLSFGERCLAVGGGDCDVQSALLAAILARAGLSVRLAVGFVGTGGRALPGLHAWVEFRNDGEAWRVADASRGGAPGTSVPSSPPAEDRSRISTVESPQTDMGAATRQAVLPHSWMGRPGGRAAVIAVVFGLVAVGGTLIVRRRIAVHHVGSTDTPNLVGLLRGALARPEAYREVPALFSRRLIPLLGGTAISLDRARALARRGRLAVSATSSGLASRVAETGLPVIDGDRPEGAVVASTLGAVDLDRWDGIVTRGGGHPAAEHLQRAAAMVGENWQVAACAEFWEDIGVLDGPLAGLGRHGRVVAVDEGGVLWRRVIELGAVRPAAAVLLLADLVTDRLRTSPEKKRRLLSILAAEAVIEEMEGRS